MIVFFNRQYAVLLFIGLAIVSFWIIAYPLQNELKKLYHVQESPIVYDRYNKEIALLPNAKGYNQRSLASVSPRIASLLLQKEDRFFYYHPGINPLSILRDAAQFLLSRNLTGSSTITQQVVKMLLGYEQERTLANKFKESIYALALEAYVPKKDILSMYLNSAYFGNKAQGITQASLFYYHTLPEGLTDQQILVLLATLNNPSQSYPGTASNERRRVLLARIMRLPLEDTATSVVPAKTALPPSPTSFELRSLGIACRQHCQVTIDQALTSTLRESLARNLGSPSFAGVKNGAIVVIKLPENELLAIVGSPNPSLRYSGYQINMAIKPRPIGSTAKPFIYANAFKKGARPYTLVDDKEYKYTIGTGFAFYPKNYDGQYRGIVTLHQALVNSLNVPSVKTLEFVGLPEFYHFLRTDLAFKPLQPIEHYELGIALGSLEMDLLTLCHYFTLFPNQGILKPLRAALHGWQEKLTLPMEHPLLQEKTVIPKDYIALVNKILSDRDIGIDQFGMKSNLNVPARDYAVKTGTSRDFHDSWTIGYTPDFLVGVWVGNSDNTPMWQLSGQAGAGRIWHDAMEVMLNSPYYHKTPFDFSSLREFTQSGSIEYGLARDDYEAAKMLMSEYSLITYPHQGDTFIFDQKTSIPLRASRNVQWFINAIPVNHGLEFRWHPPQPGAYTIRAYDEAGISERVTIHIRLAQE